MEKTIFEALAKAQGKFKPAIKDSSNPFFKSKYADLGQVFQACKDALNENGLFVSQSTDYRDGVDVLVTRIYHGSGNHIESVTRIICAKPNDPQAFGSAMTYARRYALAGILGIITDDDDDAEGAMNRQEAKPQTEDNRPWLDEKGFLALKKRVSEGDLEAYKKARDYYRMKKEYNEELKKLAVTPA